MQPRNRLLIREFEAESLRVVIDGLNFTEFEVNPSLVTAGEDLGTFLGLFSNPGREYVLVETSSNANSANSNGNCLESAALGSCSLAAVQSAERLSEC